jgi:DNA polymerase-3 subunit epsilon
VFAIVDIETSGGNAATGAITEIAIVLHSGTEVEGRFCTLVNPQQPIPRYITALTGISDAMVADAPSFQDIAEQVHRLLCGRVFVAHNVNFDYSFVFHQLQKAGVWWQAKKLCTVRYARKVLPGRSSYSLGNICRDLGIANEQRHRAGGDADATTQLFEYLLSRDAGQQHLQTFLKGKTAEHYLPMHLPAAELNKLPFCPGVYYFKDRTGKVLYVGKAANLRFRVRSHFANNSSSQRKQDFLRQIHAIDYHVCVSELHALVWEELEIKRLWPLYNRSQKGFNQWFGLYELQDQRGLTRLAVEKRRKHLQAIASFHRVEEGYRAGRQLQQRFEIDEQLFFATAPANRPLSAEEIEQHNQKMQQAIEHLRSQLPDLLIADTGCDETGQPLTVVYVIEQGRFTGIYQTTDSSLPPADIIRAQKQVLPDNEYVKALLYRHVQGQPDAVIQ